MQGTCLTSDTFFIPNQDQLQPEQSQVQPQDDSILIPQLTRPTPVPQLATLEIYHELSAISQEIEACRSAF